MEHQTVRDRRIAKSLVAATLAILFLIGNISGAFGAFWRANFPDSTDVSGFSGSTDISEFTYGHGYGSIGWWYGYGYGYGESGFDTDGVGYYYSASGNTVTGSEAFANPTAITPEQLSAVVITEGGNPDSTTGVTVTQTVSIASQTGSTSARVTLPAGVQIRLAWSGTFSTADLRTTDVSASTTVPGYSTMRGATNFGTSSGALYFSKPIRIEIPASGAADGAIFVRVNHGTGFTTLGLTQSPNATCTNGVASSTSETATVLGGVATIYTCSASVFAAVQESTTTGSTSSGGGSGGGGGWSGGSYIQKDVCPNGDYSSSYYDLKCGVAPTQQEILNDNTELSTNRTLISETITTPVQLVGTIEVEPSVNTDGTKRFVLTSSQGEIVFKTNTNAELSILIPANTVVTSSSGWDGSFQAPIQIRNADTDSRGVMVLFAGNKNASLSFSNLITFTVPVAYENGTEIEVYTAANNTDTFRLHAKSIVENGRVKFTTDHLSYFLLKPVTAEDSTSVIVPVFPDIAESFAKEYIETLASMGVIGGFDDGTFRPDSTATRAEFLKMAMKGLEVPYDTSLSTTTFTDIDTAWQIPLVEGARQLGIVSGQVINGQLSFRPNDSITRAEAMKILMKASKLPTDNFATRSFTDLSDSWQYEYVESARAYGIVGGQVINGQLSFRPNDSITRAEVAKVVVLTGQQITADTMTDTDSTAGIVAWDDVWSEMIDSINDTPDSTDQNIFMTGSVSN